MAVRQVIYEREFTSETDKVDISYHGSPQYEDRQTNSEEDNLIRNGTVNDFAFRTNFRPGPISTGVDSWEGFDGSQSYQWRVYGGVGGKGKKHEKYITKFTIRKAGSREAIQNPCDLEEFLLENKFGLVKD